MLYSFLFPFGYLFFFWYAFHYIFSFVSYAVFCHRVPILLLEECPRPALLSPQHRQRGNLQQLTIMQDLMTQVRRSIFLVVHFSILNTYLFVAISCVNLIFVDFVGTDSAGPARSRLSLQLDQRSLHFAVNAWVNGLNWQMYISNYFIIYCRNQSWLNVVVLSQLAHLLRA